MSVDAVIATVAASQHGVISRAQAREHGLTSTMIRHRLATGRWDRLHRSVYRIAGAVPSWWQALVAACFAWGPHAVASHVAAAALRGLPGFAPGIPEITVPRSCGRNGPGIVHRPRHPLDPVDVTIVDAIPVTTVARTLIDVAACVPRATLEEALDDALRRGLVTLARLRWRLEQMGRMGRSGVADLRALIDVRTGRRVPQSVFETRLLRLLKVARLPMPETQHEIRERGRLIAVVDFAYPDARLAIEADGYRWHAGRSRWRSDLTRRNAITTLGWRVIHVTWADLTEGREQLIPTLRSVLRG